MGHDGAVTTLLEIMAAYFQEQQWTFEQATDRPLLRLPFDHRGEGWTCYAEAREAQHRVIFYAVPPVTVPEHRRAAAAELIARANFGVTIGNLELDFADGEVRCKTSLDVTGDRLSPALMHSLVLANLKVMHHYLPAVKAVIAGATPADTIARAGG